MLLLSICCIAVARRRRQKKKEGHNKTGHSMDVVMQPSKLSGTQSRTHPSSSQSATSVIHFSRSNSKSHESDDGHSALARIGASYSVSGYSARNGFMIGQNSFSENVELVGIMGGSSMAVAKIAAITGGNATARTVSTFVMAFLVLV